MQFPIVSQFYNLPKNFLETFIGYVFMFKFTFARYATREAKIHTLHQHDLSLLHRLTGLIGSGLLSQPKREFFADFSSQNVSKI